MATHASKYRKTCTCTNRKCRNNSPEKVHLAAGTIARAYSVGDTFSSYNELLGRVKAFEETMHLQLVHRDSRTLEVAAKRVPKKVERLRKRVYYTINLMCVFDGKKYQNRGGGVRPQQRYAIGNQCEV